MQGAALVGRAQLALPSAPAEAESFAGAGLALCRAAGDEWWTASALNLLSEIALHMGRTDEAAAAADEALSIAQAAGDGWNEGYALGVRAAIAALAGRLREAEQLANSSISVMRRIEQNWGVARALLGLGDLARLRGDPGGAHARYLGALAILREIDARPDRRGSTWPRASSSVIPPAHASAWRAGSRPSRRWPVPRTGRSWPCS